ncbi:DUF4190 domain-containing protein [Streptomyces sp. NPDC006798]|uniref:DUF4190 domain-containing protein n=1 Tax=Streptomyces sp. NPDC006798 TaxID=3155462 RepID=UPI0033C1AC7F
MTERPSGSAPGDRDPWAAPEDGAARDGDRAPDRETGQGADRGTNPAAGPDLTKGPTRGAGAVPPGAGPGTHDLPTMTSLPSAGPTPVAGTGAGAGAGAVPPPPTAPGGPGRSMGTPYGTRGTADLYGAYTPESGYQAPRPVAPPVHPQLPVFPESFGWSTPEAKQNTMGTASLVLGICSVVMFCVVGLNLVLGVLAVVFGVLGRKRVRRGEADNGSQATAGLVLGVIGTAAGLLLAGAIFWADSESSSYEERSAATAVVTVAADTTGPAASGR